MAQQISVTPMTCVSNIFACFVSTGSTLSFAPISVHTDTTKMLGLYIVRKDFTHFVLDTSAIPVQRTKALVSVLSHYAFPSATNRLFAIDRLFRPKAEQVSSRRLARFSQSCEHYTEHASQELERCHAHHDLRWAVSETNTAFTVVPSYPPAFVVPSACSDSELSSCTAHWLGSRSPVWRWSDANMESVSNRGWLGRASPPSSSALQQLRTALSVANVVSADTSRVPAGAYRGLCRRVAKKLQLLRIEQAALNDDAVLAAMAADNAAFVVINARDIVPDASRLAAAASRMLFASTIWVKDKRFLTYVDASHWMNQVSDCLSLSLFAARLVAPQRFAQVTNDKADSTGLKQHGVLILGNDGADALVTSLVKILVDPHYRTVQGLCELVQDEWQAYGYAFRSCHGMVSKQSGATAVKKEASQRLSSAKTKRSLKRRIKRRPSFVRSSTAAFASDHAEAEADSQDANDTHHLDIGTCPLFLLFLDCVQQLIVQQPSLFEYTEAFLRQLWGWTFSSVLSFSVFDSLAEMLEVPEHESMPSLLKIIAGTPKTALLVNGFVHLLYSRKEQVADSSFTCLQSHLRLWRRLYCFNEQNDGTELVPRQAVLHSIARLKSLAMLAGRDPSEVFAKAGLPSSLTDSLDVSPATVSSVTLQPSSGRREQSLPPKTPDSVMSLPPTQKSSTGDTDNLHMQTKDSDNFDENEGVAVGEDTLDDLAELGSRFGRAYSTSADRSAALHRTRSESPTDADETLDIAHVTRPSHDESSAAVLADAPAEVARDGNSDRDEEEAGTEADGNSDRNEEEAETEAEQKDENVDTEDDDEAFDELGMEGVSTDSDGADSLAAADFGFSGQADMLAEVQQLAARLDSGDDDDGDTAAEPRAHSVFANDLPKAADPDLDHSSGTEDTSVDPVALQSVTTDLSASGRDFQVSSDEDSSDDDEML